jgi:hypothetical protein
MAMAMVEESAQGPLYLSVVVIRGENVPKWLISSYRISRVGIHFITRDNQRHFIPHANVIKMTVEAIDGTEWK